ncbi:MAG: hypothetical protein LBE18_07890 [Planctomycetaceae bacterium]|jgi:hypothetical protein|nr:hypothetical protein [Planctomycetaceae bacterium]
MKIHKQLLISILGGIGLFIIIAIVILYRFGSVGAMTAYLHGQSVYVYPKRINLDNQKPETKTVVTFYMKNLTSKEISVVGEKSSCSCAFSEKIPITAKPHETVELKINIHLPEYETRIMIRSFRSWLQSRNIWSCIRFKLRQRFRIH